MLALMLTFTIASHAVSAKPPEEITNSIGMKFKLISGGRWYLPGDFCCSSFRSKSGLQPSIMR
jgi:hypothetical protein